MLARWRLAGTRSRKAIIGNDLMNFLHEIVEGLSLGPVRTNYLDWPVPLNIQHFQIADTPAADRRPKLLPTPPHRRRPRSWRAVLNPRSFVSLRNALVRYSVPAIVAITLIALIGVPYTQRILAGWFRSDVQMRAKLIMTTMEDSLADLLERSDRTRAQAYLERVAGDERLLGIMLCDSSGQLVLRTARLPVGLRCGGESVAGIAPATRARDSIDGLEISDFPLRAASGATYEVRIVHDLAFIERRQGAARNFVLAFALIAVGALALALAVVLRVLLQRWITLLVGDISSRRFLDDAESSGTSLPVLMKVRQALRELEASQRLEIEFQENWTPHALQQVAREQLQSCPMFVVSNREPYIHNLDGDGPRRGPGARQAAW